MLGWRAVVQLGHTWLVARPCQTMIPITYGTFPTILERQSGRHQGWRHEQRRCARLPSPRKPLARGWLVPAALLDLIERFVRALVLDFRSRDSLIPRKPTPPNHFGHRIDR